MDIAHEFGPQGLFVSLTPYIEAGDMPNLAAEMERQPDMEQLMTSPDGDIYAVPRSGAYVSCGRGCNCGRT